MPDFLVIGAAKSGTTSLYRYLDQHPDIFMSAVKEPRFFALGEQPWPFVNDGGAGRRVLDRVEYQRLFAGARMDQRAGEASVLDLYMPRSVERIRTSIPSAQFIAILRQPAERAFSHHAMMRRAGVEPLTFEQAIAEEDRRAALGWHPAFLYRRRGLYDAQIGRYQAAFGAQSLKVVLYEDLCSDASGLMSALYSFLGVSADFVPQVSVRHNEGGVAPRHPELFRLLIQARRRLQVPVRWRVGRRLLSRLLLKPVALSPETRDALTRLCREDVLCLSDRIDRDLSHWLK